VSVDGLRIERDAGVLRLTFDRPERLNALTTELIHAAADAIEEAAGDGTRVIVLTGTGRAFSSGADVGADGPRPADTVDAANWLAMVIAGSPLVVVAAVNGIAAGSLLDAPSPTWRSHARRGIHAGVHQDRAHARWRCLPRGRTPWGGGTGRAWPSPPGERGDGLEWGLIAGVVPTTTSMPRSSGCPGCSRTAPAGLLGHRGC
jgi:hypothetical protein